MPGNLPEVHTLLIQPPFNQDERRRAPSQLMSMATVANGLASTLVLDGQSLGLTIQELAEMAASTRAAITGISMLSPTFPASVKLAQLIKALRPETLMLAGGKHVTLAHEQVIASGAFDLLALGEGDEVLPKVISAQLSSGHNLKEIQQRLSNLPGVTYPGDPFIPRLAPPVNINQLPAVDWNILYPDIRSYLGQTASVEDSRGCVHDCTYCSASITRKGVSFREPMQVKKDVENLLQIGFVDIFFNGDDCFINPKRTMEMLETIATIKLPFTLALNARADSFMRCYRKFGQRFLTGLMNAHVKTLHIGIESGDPNILQLVNKKLSIEDVFQTISIANRLGIIAETNWIVGLPDDSEVSIHNSIEFALKLRERSGPHFPHLSYFMPYPGTLDAKRAAESGLYNPATFDLSRLTAHDEPILPTKSLSVKQVKGLYIKFLEKFYSPQFISSLPIGEFRSKAQKMYLKLKK